jgi:hypothetical protein
MRAEYASKVKVEAARPQKIGKKVASKQEINKRKRK